jgi:pimeloyl-ACP methyl ester carboxylesterase
MSDQEFKKITVKEVEIFYREAGSKNNPTILLLHGFPSSSHMYRDLINDLSGDYHLIAPDYRDLDKVVRPVRPPINIVSITSLPLSIVLSTSWH